MKNLDTKRSFRESYLAEEGMCCRKIVSVFFVCFLVVGCGENADQQAAQDMQEFVEMLRVDLANQSEPELQKFEPNLFSQNFGFKDIKTQPFSLANISAPQKVNDSQVSGLVRSRQPLEAYSLNELKLVGAIRYSGKKFAVLKAPDQRVYSLSLGDYIGTNQGEILEVDVAKVSLKLREKFKEPSGNWGIREVEISAE